MPITPPTWFDGPTRAAAYAMGCTTVTTTTVSVCLERKPLNAAMLVWWTCGNSHASCVEPFVYSPFFFGGLHWHMAGLSGLQRVQRPSVTADPLVFAFRVCLKYTYVRMFILLLGLFRAGCRRVHCATSPAQCGKVGARGSERDTAIQARRTSCNLYVDEHLHSSMC